MQAVSVPVETSDRWLLLIAILIPLLVQIVTVIPSIISNRKKTQNSLETMKNDITADITATKNQVTTLQRSFDEHVDEYEEAKAKAARYRILRFYDEVCENVDHSESHWEDILDDVDFYESFCETHPRFKNNRGRAAMEYLKETYKKLKAKGAFLTHKGD